MARRLIQPLDLAVHIPYHFRCPISLELMSDPVTISSGQTYDRLSIESWVATGNTTCPVTRAPLSDFTLTPNHTLRRLIQHWCVANRPHGVQRIPTPKQPADPALLRSLLHQASSLSASFHSRLAALRTLRQLARDSDTNRSLISATNLPQPLLSIAFSTPHNTFIDLTYESIAILSMLNLTESQCAFVGSHSDRLTYLVSLLFHSSIELRLNSAALLEIVVSGSRSPELRAQICDADDIFVGVIGILRIPVASPRALKIGMKALLALCLVKQHRHKAITAGAVEALTEKLAEFEKCDAERAVATMELLCRTQSGCDAFAAHALTVPLLVKIILKVSERATEYAAGALLSLCSSYEQSQQEAVAAGVLTQLLLLLQSDCTERAKRKAQMLLKLLRHSWPQDSIANSDDYACTDVVRF